MSYYLNKVFRILGFGNSIDPLVEQKQMAEHITGSDLDEENHSSDSSAKEIERLKKEIQMIEASNQILISDLHEKIRNLTLENSELKNKCEGTICQQNSTEVSSPEKQLVDLNAQDDLSGRKLSNKKMKSAKAKRF